jgi:hypothetical protein
LQHAVKLFQHNISLLFGRTEAHLHVKFTGVEVAGSAEITTPVEKTVAGLHNVRVEHKLCVG